MPEEKVINFNVGYLKVNFMGKLRLTQDRNVPKTVDIQQGGPVGTYGIIEDRDLYIKFDKPVMVKQLYMRLHKEPEESYKAIEANITGYKNESPIFSHRFHITYNGKNWT